MIKCPKCQYEFDLREASVDDDWRAIINLLPAFGPHARLVFEYVELFGVTPLKRSTKKLFRNLEALAKLFAYGKFEFNRQTHSISEAGIVEAMTTTCNAELRLPLTDHNYLKKVMIGISDRERKEARDAEDRKQREREQQRVPRPSPADAPGITAEEYKRQRGIESLAASVGKKI